MIFKIYTWLKFLINQGSIDFCSDLHIHIIVWVIYTSIKNIMKWIVITFLVFYIVF
jgi:hypothetical protein